MTDLPFDKLSGLGAQPPEQPTPAGAFDPETRPEVGDPMALLTEGMEPLPPDTDMDRLIAAYDLIGRAGLADFEVGYDDSLGEGAWWYAKCSTGHGQTFMVAGRQSPDLAAEALARKIANGGRCTHCGKVTSLHPYPYTEGMPRPKGVLSSVCYWNRAGKQWVRGCAETHAEGERTKDAINDYIERTGSPARREV